MVFYIANMQTLFIVYNEKFLIYHIIISQIYSVHSFSWLSSILGGSMLNFVNNKQG